MKYNVEIRFCEIKGMSFNKNVERIDIYFPSAENTWINDGFCSSSVNGIASFREYGSVDGRSKKYFPCTVCSFIKDCKKKKITVNSRPIILLLEIECI